MKSRSRKNTPGGFTLVEIVTTIVILGILSAITSSFFKPAIDSYRSVSQRAALSEEADMATRQISRELHTALPNSLRQASTSSTRCIEFLPIAAGGRYRVQPDANGAGDVLDFAATDLSFDVLAEEGLSAAIATEPNPLVVIYNLGQSGANAYRAEVSAAIDTKLSSTSRITLKAGKAFPFASPGNRFFVIPNQSVVYSCNGNAIARTTRAITAAPPVNCPEINEMTLIADHLSACQFSYTPAVDQRNGLVTFSLQLTRGGETVTLHQEVLIANVP